MFKEDILLAESEYSLEVYNVILKYTSLAQSEFDQDQEAYIEYLKEIKKMLEEINKSIPAWMENALCVNFQILNNYYKFLCTCALEDHNKEALAELKYHLLELIAAWKGKK